MAEAESNAAVDKDAAVDKAEERRQRWSDLPDAVAPEETTASQDSVPAPPDLVDDPEHEFMIRHAG